VGSRPYGKSAWDGKPAGVISVSTGTVGGFGANHHLRQSLVFLNMPAMAQPEVYRGGVAGLLDESGQLKVPSTKEFLNKFIVAFDSWVRLHAKK
jgi:chromate reductase